MYFKKTLLTGLSLGLIVPGFAAEATTEIQADKKTDKPNIIFFLADDAGKFDFGCYGQDLIKTPNINKLAEEGMLFTEHYAGAPVSAPSRCSLLTGKHTGHSFIRDNYEIQPEGQLALPEDEITIASFLKEAGYATAGFGKWGLGSPGSESVPNKKGFDYWFGYLCQREAHSYYPSHLWENETKVLLDNDFTSGHDRNAKIRDPNNPASYEKYIGKEYSGKLILEKAENYLREVEGPFFMYYATPLPHVALQIPFEEMEPYIGLFDEKPYLAEKGYLPQQYPLSAYAAMVTRIDKDLGRLVEVLKEKGEYENTLIIFTSDNGATFNVGGANTDFFKSNGNARDYKGSVYQGGLAIPFIASWPKQIKAGSRTNHLSAHWDFFATACEIAGVENSSGIDSISYLPTLLGQNEKQEKHEYLYWEHNRRMQALIIENYKIIKIGKLGRLQIYDLENDPEEKFNLGSNKEFRELRKQAKDIFKNGRIESKIFPLYK